VIADLESLGREVDFEEFLDGITSRLGDKETRVPMMRYRLALTRFLIYLTMITPDPLTQTTYAG